MANKGGKISQVAIIILICLSLILGACGEERKPTPDYSSALTPLALRPTLKPPYQPATNITPDPTGSAIAATVLVPTTTPSPLASPLPTPILIPTPTTPTEAVVTADDLGITGWTDTEISWSPTGDQFLLHILRGEDQFDFYFLVRPPASPTASFKLSRTTFGSLSWSPDGRYISYIDQDAEGNPGPVEVIDTINGLNQPRELFRGPCTNAAWLRSNKVVAACGQVVYGLSVEVTDNIQSETLYKLEGGRFPGSSMDLNLIARVLPSPDGSTLAFYGLARQKSSLPLGEIAFLNLATNQLNLLDRNNRSVAMVDWTPDSKYLVVRNLMGDWAVAYTFDFYLADPAKQRILQNLTRSNDKCDPVLGAKPECQGLQPASYQVGRLLFASDGNRYLFTGVRYIAQPNVALDTVERVALGALSGGKAEKPVELISNEKIVGATWLPDGHYFYSRSPLKGPAQPILDGQVANLKSNGLSNLIKSGTPQAKTVSPKPSASVTGTRSPETTKTVTGTRSPEATKPVASNIIPELEGTPSTFLTPSPSPDGTHLAVSVPLPFVTFAPIPTATLSLSTTVTLPASPTATQPIFFPSVTSAIAPSGTQLILIYTATPDLRSPTTVRSTATPKASVSPTPETTQFRPLAFYASPLGNWVISLEQINSSDKSVQFQIRLIPFSVK
ncbi:MAG: hypothetical protein HXX20_10045 [Chloroflexi bacterium]|nr:hypothetical protein [Chloroflexota bacterium]